MDFYDGSTLSEGCDASSLRHQGLLNSKSCSLRFRFDVIILYLEHRAINPRAESHFYISLWSAEIVSSENLRLARQPSPLDLIRCRYAELHSTCCQLLYFVKLPMSAVDHTLLSQPHQNRHCFWCTKKKLTFHLGQRKREKTLNIFLIDTILYSTGKI